MATPRMLPGPTTKKNPRITDIVAGVRARTGALATRARQTAIGKRAGEAGQRLAARVRERPDSLTGLAAGNYGKGAAAFAFGAVDRTDMAKQFETATRIKPSTVALVLSLGSRVLGLDAGHPRLRAATTATLVGLALPKIYELGGRVTDGVHAAAAVPPAAPPKTAGATGTAGYVPGESETDRPGEGIPPEATIS